MNKESIVKTYFKSSTWLKLFWVPAIPCMARYHVSQNLKFSNFLRSITQDKFVHVHVPRQDLGVHKLSSTSIVVVVKRGVQSHLVSWIRRGVMVYELSVRHVHAHCSRDRCPLQKYVAYCTGSGTSTALVVSAQII